MEFPTPFSLSLPPLSIPFEIFDRIAGRETEPVSFEVDQGKLVVRWNDHGVPQIVERSVESPPPESATASPTSDMRSNRFELWHALAATVSASTSTSTRYALGCLQLRGSRGQIVATDGQQLLFQDGFEFPWQEDVLIPAIQLLGSRHWPRCETIDVGTGGDWIVFRGDCWTVQVRVERKGRFPHVDDCVPAAASTRSHLVLSPSDAEFFLRSLPGLPCDDSAHNPITCDLNGQVIVRAKSQESESATALVLSNSQYEGEPALFTMNRQFLARALKLGFREFDLNGPQTPIVARDPNRQFVWTLLDPQSAVKANSQTISTASPPQSTFPRVRLRARLPLPALGARI